MAGAREWAERTAQWADYEGNRVGLSAAMKALGFKRK